MLLCYSIDIIKQVYLCYLFLGQVLPPLPPGGAS